MGLFLALVMLGSMAFAQAPAAGAKPEQNGSVPSASEPASSPGDLPALPEGKSTVIGGTIYDVDPVTDQLTLRVFGGRSMKILFDERTQVYRDGKKTSLQDLRAKDHASVETMLDGTAVFARSIHMLSQSPEGECQGQVLSFDPARHELTLTDSLSHESLRLRVPAGTVITRNGQAASASGAAGTTDLVKGTLIAAKFQSDNSGQGVATQIAVLATPGSKFSFSGDVTFLDLRAREFVVANAQDNESYKIFFDPASFPATRELHEGAHVKVTADFDGTRYVASAISIN